ncbi:threonine/serine dehydratase [Coralliovum pocilloporae]|uniref:threonine/serine dehydratase n=1 Tax=Coralliovum pocilloporae TaxID=3066369 RepID=UPI003307B077
MISPEISHEITPKIAPEAIRQTYSLIQPHIRQTPVINMDGAEFGLTNPVSLKLELFQHSGSFKARGAFTNLLTRSFPEAGVAAASGGNHGAAVAFAARKLNVPANIFVPSISSPAKIELIRQAGANVHVEGDRYADALAFCEAFQAQTGADGIHAYDAPETLLGQATTGLEWQNQTDTLDTVLVAVGGGGLIGGLANWFQGRVNVIGVEPEGASALHQALDAGAPTDVDVNSLAADSLGARRIGQLGFDAMKAYGSGTVLVSDNAIRQAQTRLWQTMRIAAEPGGAAALAALLSGAYTPAPQERLGILVCGGNLDPATLTG